MATVVTRRPAAKIGRDAFIYLPPGTRGDDNAQCQTCRMWVPDAYTRFGHDVCILHGRDVKTPARASCGLYANWPEDRVDQTVVQTHAQEMRAKNTKSVTPEQSGLVDREVRCENCFYFEEDEGDCDLYEQLNRKLPNVYDLDIKVEEDGCCNAQTEIARTRKLPPSKFIRRQA